MVLSWVLTGWAGPGVSWVVQAKINPHLCFAWGCPARVIKQSEMAATVSGLEIPRHQGVNLGCWFRAWGSLTPAAAGMTGFRKLCEPRPAIHMEKQVVWACKLGGAESLGISKAGQGV